MATRTTYTSTELSSDRSDAFEQGVTQARLRAGSHDLLIGGKHRPGRGGTLEERNPADQREELGVFAAASAEDVAEAAIEARAAQAEWGRMSVEDRVTILLRAANLIAQRAGDIAAVASLEVGKNRVESAGEVDEAVELIRVYASQMSAGFELELDSESPGDIHRSVMKPYGVFAVIAPFNFPLALTTGPAAAALAAGNTVVVKPSPTTSWTGVLLGDVLHEAGLPDGAFNLVTGGDETGQALVESRDVDGIVFTGSHAVGMHIARTFAAGGSYPRPSIIEMGGKNPAIVTRSADLSIAPAGIARSAFGLSGQKCSACSWVLVDETVHDELIDRLVAEAETWTVADPTSPHCRLGPVHTQEAFERYEAVIAEARRVGRVVFGGRVLRDGELAHGWFVAPTIVAGLPSGHRLTHEELFVPVLAVHSVSSLDEALQRANGQVYGLTAGLFSREQGEIDAFLGRIEAGTLFVNRAAGATSGGWPGQQTYCGWKGSGSTGRGALGPRYVGQFLREQGRNIVATS
jgi:1-pyrroline-5-carboxylate dehydrogenase